MYVIKMARLWNIFRAADILNIMSDFSDSCLITDFKMPEI